jgi:DNA-binding NtrC family response regulator
MQAIARRGKVRVPLAIRGRHAIGVSEPIGGFGPGRLERIADWSLTQVRIHVPPLRERADEILPLSQFFLSQRDPNLTFSAEAQQALLRYHWPGNLRELKNVVARCAILCEGSQIDLGDLPEEIKGRPTIPNSMNRYRLEALEEQTIDEVLSLTRGHHEKAADLLGISRRTLSRKLRAYATNNSSQRGAA